MMGRWKLGVVGYCGGLLVRSVDFKAFECYAQIYTDAAEWEYGKMTKENNMITGTCVSKGVFHTLQSYLTVNPGK